MVPQEACGHFPFRSVTNGSTKTLFSEIIYTRRLQLRRIRETDLPLVLKWSICKTACGPYLTPEPPMAQNVYGHGAEDLFWHPNDRTFLIETRTPQVPIGTIHFWLRQDLRQTAGVTVKIALVNYRGNGYGTEAQKFLIIHLFERLGIRNIEMYTDINNRAQQRCLQKLGFRIDRSLHYDDGNVKRTGNLYRLTEKDFQSATIYRFHYE